MASFRLTQIVTFKRIRPDAVRDDAGQVDDSLEANWHAIGKRRSSIEQKSSTEVQGQKQQRTQEEWIIVCRGDELTRSVTHQDRVEFVENGQTVKLNITGSRTIQRIPQYIEVSGRRA